MVNVFGLEMDAGVFIAIIGAVALLLSIWLKHIFMDSRHFKSILQRLGDFKQSSLESMIGDKAKEMSLSNQTGQLSREHNQISEAIAEVQRFAVEETVLRQRATKDLDPAHVLDQVRALAHENGRLQAENAELSKALHEARHMNGYLKKRLLEENPSLAKEISLE
jgi:regulator of replication initiation timing